MITPKFLYEDQEAKIREKGCGHSDASRRTCNRSYRCITSSHNNLSGGVCPYFEKMDENHIFGCVHGWPTGRKQSKNAVRGRHRRTTPHKLHLLLAYSLIRIYTTILGTICCVLGVRWYQMFLPAFMCLYGRSACQNQKCRKNADANNRSLHKTK